MPPMLRDLQPDWESRSEYCAHVPGLSSTKFLQIVNLLLERPNLNSTHLFRADILFDSGEQLETVSEKSRIYAAGSDHATSIIPAVDLPNSSEKNTFRHDHTIDPPKIPLFVLERTIVRKLIPRNAQLDWSIEQSCFVYTATDGASCGPHSVLVLHFPHTKAKEGLPWYHPKVRAFSYEFTKHDDGALLGVSYLPLPEVDQPASQRLHRTILSLLQTFLRLSKHDAPTIKQNPKAALSASTRPLHAAALRDTIIPQHIVQDTYARLKQRYAAELIGKWTEKTDPAKHVFEDLGIAAFIIELWKIMYHEDSFPGFVDIACGNGVLVYVLIQEGYKGYGFDARKRKTWEILGIDEYLKTMLCIPQPFLDVLTPEEVDFAVDGCEIHNGIFDADRFIISNHADELTLWTPILAAIASPSISLPFLAIPCCSHALDGSRRRYTLRDIDAGIVSRSSPNSQLEPEPEPESPKNAKEQPVSGDLRALKAEKTKAAFHSDGARSAYACLTKKTVALAEELGTHIDLTLMRIPSTRNIGIVGNRNRNQTAVQHQLDTTAAAATGDLTEREKEQGEEKDDGIIQDDRVSRLLHRECGGGGTDGLRTSALNWIDRAHKLISGPGRGKVNLGTKNTLTKTTLTGEFHEGAVPC